MSLIEDNIPKSIKNKIIYDDDNDSELEDFINKVIIENNKKFINPNHNKLFNRLLHTNINIESIKSNNDNNDDNNIYNVIKLSLKTFVFIMFIKKITPDCLFTLNETFGYINTFMLEDYHSDCIS